MKFSIRTFLLATVPICILFAGLRFLSVVELNVQVRSHHDTINVYFEGGEPLLVFDAETGQQVSRTYSSIGLGPGTYRIAIDEETIAENRRQRALRAATARANETSE